MTKMNYDGSNFKRLKISGILNNCKIQETCSSYISPGNLSTHYDRVNFKCSKYDSCQLKNSLTGGKV